MFALRHLLALGVAAALITGCGGEPQPQSPASKPQPTGKAPAAPALKRLEQESGRLLDGSPEEFRQRLAELEGYPVVVNQWASWCGPCRREFPFFQRQAAKYRGKVAFLEVDSQDVRDDAEEFLRELPTPFPHFYDKDASIARVFRGGTAWPTTAFYTASGKLAKAHYGAYASEAKLEHDVKAFALDG